MITAGDMLGGIYLIFGMMGICAVSLIGYGIVMLIKKISKRKER